MRSQCFPHDRTEWMRGVCRYGGYAGTEMVQVRPTSRKAVYLRYLLPCIRHLLDPASLPSVNTSRCDGLTSRSAQVAIHTCRGIHIFCASIMLHRQPVSTAVDLCCITSLLLVFRLSSLLLIFRLPSLISHLPSPTSHLSPLTSHLSPLILHLASCILHLASCILHLASCILHLASCICSLHPASCSVHLPSPIHSQEAKENIYRATVPSPLDLTDPGRVSL
jgi:hypothetical protein